MIRILHVLEAVRGGTSRHVEDIVRSTPQFDHHVVIPHEARIDLSSGAVVDVGAISAMRARGATIHRIPMRRSTTHPVNPVAAAKLVGLLGRIRPAVVHGHSSVGGALARVAGAARSLPVLYTPNALATGPVVVRIERMLGLATTKLIAVSDSEAQLAARLGLVPWEKIRVIRNGIDLEPPPVAHAIDLREQFGLHPDGPLIGTVARLVPQKAPEDFVEVVRVVCGSRPDAHAVLIGMGPQQSLVDRAVAEANLGDRFHQISYLPCASAVLDQLDAFVLPSRFEGAPYTPLEAMRAGVPVVLTDGVGNADVVEDGISGRLCPVGDTAGMAQAVLDLLDDPGRRKVMVDAARRRLAKEFDIETMGQDLSDLYREVAVDGQGMVRRTVWSNLGR